MHFSTSRVHEGRIKFRISTPNSDGLDLVVFRLHRGVRFATLDADLLEEFDPSNAAKGTRDLTRDVTFYGLADVQPGTAVTATADLEDGTYYATDTSSPARASAWRHLPSVSLTSSDRFAVRGQLPANESVLVKNVSDTIHFMGMHKVVVVLG